MKSLKSIYVLSKFCKISAMSMAVALTLSACGSDDNASAVNTEKNADPDNKNPKKPNANIAPNIQLSAKTINDSELRVGLVIATYTATDTDGDKLSKTLDASNKYFKIKGDDIILTQAGVDYLITNTNVTQLSVSLTVTDGKASAQGSDKIHIIRTVVKPKDKVTAFSDNFSSANLDNWTLIDSSGSKNWVAGSYAGKTYANANCYKSTGDCDDWIITKNAIDLTKFTSATLSFSTAHNYGNNPFSQFKVLASTNFTGDPLTTTWTNLTDKAKLSAGKFEFTDSGEIDLAKFVAKPMYLAFHYKTAVSDATNWEVTNVLVKGESTTMLPLATTLNAPSGESYANRSLAFVARATNGSGKGYGYIWDFGDGETGAGNEVVHTYSKAGDYKVKLTVTDSQNNNVAETTTITVKSPTKFSLPTKDGLRVATFNVALDKIRQNGKETETTAIGQLKAVLDTGNYSQAKKIAEIIQRTNADILVLNEIDGNDNLATINSFNNHYLKVAQNGAKAINYHHIYTSDCNTGVLSGQDYDNNGKTTDPADAYGFGHFSGKYCLAILSKYPIDTVNARTFQKFLWKDMPNNLQPMNEDGSSYYSADAWRTFRISSKTHIDLPVTIDNKVVHVLVSHPTPPVFDGKEDRNGKRNFDEIRLWADYINPNSTYLYDDAGNKHVTLAKNTRFIIFGDQNASSVEGDATVSNGVTAINQLLKNPLVSNLLTESHSANRIPTSDGGAENATNNNYGKYHTAVWKMRADYVLPSAYGLKINQAGVFWPKRSDDLYYLVNPVDSKDVSSSDHRLVWMDLTVE